MAHVLQVFVIWPDSNDDNASAVVIAIDEAHARELAAAQQPPFVINAIETDRAFEVVGEHRSAAFRLTAKAEPSVWPSPEVEWGPVYRRMLRKGVIEIADAHAATEWLDY